MGQADRILGKGAVGALIQSIDYRGRAARLQRRVNRALQGTRACADGLTFLNVEPLVDELRGDMRFQKLVKKIGLLSRPSARLLSLGGAVTSALR